MIAIIDFDMGNVGSIQNMLNKIGVESNITHDIEIIKNADKLILPGDGAFDTGMQNLKSFGLFEILNNEVLVNKKPILGICIGMQMLANTSKEGKEYGLGWIDADVESLENVSTNLKIPHMGWNSIEQNVSSVIFDNLQDDDLRFYFVHSYYMKCKLEKNVLAWTSYGDKFASMVIKENIVGVQFHPEKSHRYGMQLLNNFSRFKI